MNLKRILIKFLPYYQETLVSSENAESLWQRLQSKTQAPTHEREVLMSAEMVYLRRKPINSFIFRGVFKNNSFFLQRQTNYPEHFNPLLTGKIEATSKGVILFVKYQLPGGVLFIFLLSTLIFMLVLGVFVFFQQNIVHSILALLFYLGSYTVMMLNFQQKLKISRSALEKIVFNS